MYGFLTTFCWIVIILQSVSMYAHPHIGLLTFIVAALVVVKITNASIKYADYDFLKKYRDRRAIAHAEVKREDIDPFEFAYAKYPGAMLHLLGINSLLGFLAFLLKNYGG